MVYKVSLDDMRVNCFFFKKQYIDPSVNQEEINQLIKTCGFRGVIARGGAKVWKGFIERKILNG